MDTITVLSKYGYYDNTQNSCLLPLCFPLSSIVQSHLCHYDLSLVIHVLLLLTSMSRVWALIYDWIIVVFLL